MQLVETEIKLIVFLSFVTYPRPEIFLFINFFVLINSICRLTEASEIKKNITMDTQGNVQTYPIGIMSSQPSAQDDRRSSQYDQPSAPTKTYSAPQQTSGPGGLHSNY